MSGFQFLAPEWLLAAPAFLAALVILYFLKLKRREIAVSSTYLWKKALEDLRVNSPFQRLRMNLLLLLQLLVLAAVLLALARPVSSFAGLEGRDHLILLDRSASMSATDGGSGRTRLQRAVDEARAIVDGLSMNDRALVVAFDDQAEILTPLTDQRGLLHQALQGVTATDRRTSLRAGLDVARGILADKKIHSPVVTILSDGRGGSVADLTVPKDVPVHYVRTGETGDNRAIIGLDVRRAFRGVEVSEDARVFATLANSGGEAKSVGVDCFLESELIASKMVEIPARGQASVAFESPKLGKGRLRVQIDGTDALPVDDSAYAILTERKDVKVLLVTEGNPFLERGLEEDKLVRKDADSHVPKLDPSQLVPDDPALRTFDLIILDRVEPKSLPPGNYLCIDALPPFEGLRTLANVPMPVVVDWDESHPVARFVTFSSLDATTARRVELRKEDKLIVASTRGGPGPSSHRRRDPRKKDHEKGKEKGGEKEPEAEDPSGFMPLMFEAKDGDRRALVLTFDLMKTQNWPLKAAFPIFLANVVRWLGGTGRDERSLAVLTGDVAEIPVPKGAKQLTVTDPAGKKRTIDLKPGDDVVRYADTSRTGFYEVRFDSSPPTFFAGNLASLDESDIAPADEIPLKSGPVAGEAKASDTRHEVWKLLVLIAFFVLMLEWYVYNRRVYV
ncbi:BatA domain-containing protein [bacterium]|nr:BatA domain-containing protein [bacterium]